MYSMKKEYPNARVFFYKKADMNELYQIRKNYEKYVGKEMER